jgi:putative membrane protein
MFSIITQLFLTSFSLLAASYLVPGVHVDNIYHALLAALVLGILNVSLRPILIFLTLPATIVTFGLFIFVINAGVFLFAGYLLDGFSVDGFLPALVGSLFVSVTSAITQKILT